MIKSLLRTLAFIIFIVLSVFILCFIAETGVVQSFLVVWTAVVFAAFLVEEKL